MRLEVVAPEAMSPPIEKRGVSRESRLRRALFRILSSLEEKRPTGLVLVRSADDEVGRMVVTQGRLCVAFATNDFTATGAARPPEERAERTDLRRLATEIRARGDRLSASVRSRGQEASFREAMLAETARGLVNILDACEAAEPVLEVVPARDDYDAQLALSTVETFAAALRTQFRFDWRLASETMVAVRETGAALLVVRSAEPGEQPFPVAQVGFGEGGVRKFAEAVRFVSELSRPGADARGSADTSITTFVHDGDLWRCIAGEARVVLLKAAPEVIEEGTAWAHLFVSHRTEKP